MSRHPAVSAIHGMCYGRQEVELAPGWQDVVDAWSDRLARLAPHHIWSSPRRRCLGPAELLARRLRLPLTSDNRLQELDFGAWEGMLWDDVPRDALDRWAAAPRLFAPPGGESGELLIGRTRSFARMLRDEARGCIVVSHGGPLRLLSAMLRGAPVDLLAPAPALAALEIVRVGGSSG